MIFFPSFGAIILGIFLRAENIESNKNAKLLSLVTTFATFIFSLFVIYNFNSDKSGFQLVEDPKTTVMAQSAHHPLAIPSSRKRDQMNTA